MGELDWLAGEFEKHRSHLRAVSYRMLGSDAEAEDAVQDAWLRLSRADAAGIDNLGGWLTTVVARVCLNRLRSRQVRREEPIDAHLPDPVIRPDTGDPAEEAVLADSVGLALQIVLDTLGPAERLAFVLHDMFGLSFDEIASMLERSPAATRQLASRARRRVRDAAAPRPDADLRGQRRVVDAFFAAARAGDLAALVAVLDPEVVLRADAGPRESVVVRGPAAVAGRAMAHDRPGVEVRPILVDGAAGVAVTVAGRLVTIMAFTVAGGRIAEIDVIGDPERLARIELP